MVATASNPASQPDRTQPSRARRQHCAGLLAAPCLGVAALVSADPALAQRLNLGLTMGTTVEASTNQSLRPRGEEDPVARLILSPGFVVSGTAPGGRLRVEGSGDLGAQLQLSTNSDESGTWFRPNGNLNATLEAVENFFFIDARAQASSQLDSPFLATTSPTSPFNTSTAYQFGFTPYIQGRLPYDFNYLVRSDNSWTNFSDSDMQFASTNSVDVSRRPQPLGGAFNYTRSLVSSDLPEQGNLVSEVARASLRYALTSSLALGARIGAEKYNFALLAANRGWRRFYGAEVGWNPNERTSVEGYWEDRLFGNSWQLSASHRRPLTAFTITSSRLLSTTPQQFASFPGLFSLRALLDAQLTTRVPDPNERQRLVDEVIASGQVPAQFLTPVIINAEGFQIIENNVATAVLTGKRESVSLSLYMNITTTSPGLSAAAPIGSKTRQRGVDVTYGRQLTPTLSMNTTATWRNTIDEFDASQYTRQTQLLLNMNWTLTRRTTGTLGARYQWIDSTFTNDAVEAALYATLRYTFD